MPNRILKETICTSGTIENLTPEQENFFYRLIVNCDDFGRTDGRPRIILTKCYPLKEKMSTKDIVKLVNALIEAQLVKSYVSDDQPFLFIVTWDKHQQVRAKRSKFPEPTADEYNGYHMISDDSTCHRNPIQSNPKESNPISETSPLLSEVFEMMWTAYPRKKGKVDARKKWDALIKNGVDPDKVISATKRYAEECKGKEQKFIKLPVTFLGPGKHYEEYLQAESEVKPVGPERNWNNMTEEERKNWVD